MLAKKKKLTKKQIKEDKLVTSYYQVKSFYEENQSKMFMAAGTLLVILVAIFWYSSKVEQDNLAATAALTRIIPIYESGAFQEAIDGKAGTNLIGLKEIVSLYSGTEQGEAARIYLANAYYFLGQFEPARLNYDDYSGSNKLLIAAAHAGLAACAEIEGDYDEAASFYKKAANVTNDNPQNGEYLLAAGKNLIKAEKNADAEEILNSITEKYKESQAAGEVERYLSVLK